MEPGQYYYPGDSQLPQSAPFPVLQSSPFPVWQSSFEPMQPAMAPAVYDAGMMSNVDASGMPFPQVDQQQQYQPAPSSTAQAEPTPPTPMAPPMQSSPATTEMVVSAPPPAIQPIFEPSPMQIYAPAAPLPSMQPEPTTQALVGGSPLEMQQAPGPISEPTPVQQTHASGLMLMDQSIPEPVLAQQPSASGIVFAEQSIPEASPIQQTLASGLVPIEPSIPEPAPAQPEFSSGPMLMQQSIPEPVAAMQEPASVLPPETPPTPKMAPVTQPIPESPSDSVAEDAREPSTPTTRDSMVTVRLSEPASVQDDGTGAFDGRPQLTPVRRSLFTNEHTYTPANAMAEVLTEEVIVDGRASPVVGLDAAAAATAATAGNGLRSSQEELENGGGPGADSQRVVLEAGEGSANKRPGSTSSLLQQQAPLDIAAALKAAPLVSADDPAAAVPAVAATMDNGDHSPTSETEEDVDWDGLKKREDEQLREQEADNTALLLARLEQENAKLATNPKTVKVKPAESLKSPTKKPRPPSMAMLRDMVNGPTPPALRYSMLPPPPMTDLEFYAALVKDYEQTAARLPTLLSHKIRKGIPPPLRGVVWQSISGARDVALEEEFERLSGETSPFEGIIGKDLGRSFPGVEMFRDADGEGQRMLGRVLRCYSVYDPEIGYCQGLAFLVGPLLMHMPDKQAFCVLVRLMENYDLRSCFLPDLAGLHVRIYQFSQLLRANMPAISAHLDDLQVDPVYVSQWWLSCFAVTAPLPMLFRMYDVLFAEGVSETLMRVALSLMRKNETRLLACSELEDAMQLLLSRAFWDCYGYNADEFVNDFAGLSDVVDREKLALLEQAYHRDAQLAAPADANPSAARQTSDVTTAASRFLGRLATSISSGSTFSSRTITASATVNSTPTTLQPAPSSKMSTATASNNTTTTTATDPTAAAANNNNNSDSGDNNTSSAAAATTAAANLSPGLVAAPRPMSMLRRSASKHSIASTLGSMEAHSTSTSSAASVLSSASTDATSISRDSAASDAPAIRRSATHPASFGSSSSRQGPAKTGSSDERYLNSQIEDLLTALSDLQRQQAQLADQLQREREEREEDRQAVRSLLTGLKQADIPASIPPPPTPADVPEDGAQAAIPLSGLFVIVEERFGGGNSQDEAAKSLPTSETKTQLQEQLARAKEQLAHEIAKGQEKNRQQADLEQEISTLKDQLQDSRSHVRNMHQDKQRLEKQIHNMRARASAAETAAAATASPIADGSNTAADWLSRATGVGASPPAAAAAAKGGLRELKLGRSRSTPSQVPTGPTGLSKRASTMTTHSLLPPAAAEPTSEHEALLLELVQAKTAEAMARQEADEAKQKLERLRKTIGVTTEATSTGSPAANAASTAASAAMGMFGRFTSAVSETTANKTASAPPAVSATPPAAAAPSPVPASAPATSVGGFFGWRRG
ncbi:hypothetical protein MAPG_00856 [Magnaporthiopsis poae ATCC 64411]|uniref:Rab-GAP TBC domain-containing protein n=1 Tax=Magnaporthiopsis poae (strain ATCC 64411 / 73-15) TaxID=644358 RepID=A0A0C4DM55_MAGP6|nr:hypothetical protein MAPG_00856 [Magnaporthiopsis poae ATCC 64411]